MGKMRTERGFAWGDGHTMPCADDVLLNCTHGFVNQCHPNIFNSKQKKKEKKKVEGSNKKEKGLMDMDNSAVIAGGEGVIKGLSGITKKYNKNVKNKQPNIFKSLDKLPLD